MCELENNEIKFKVVNQILYSEFKKPIDIGLEEIKGIIKLRLQISNNVKQYWCLDTSGVRSFNKEAKDYTHKFGFEHISGVSIIVNSHLTKFIANSYLLIKKPKMPYKMFTNEKDGVAWLIELKTKNESLILKV